MIDYIKQLANTILLIRKGERPPSVYKNISTYELLTALTDELYRLDPRDFEPAARHDFIVARVAIKTEAENPQHNTEIVSDIVSAVLPLLDHYTGEGALARSRDFSFMTSTNVRKIVERDYRELTLRAFPDGAWKSTVILAGGILEAILYDRLTKDPATVAQAMKAKEAPKAKGTVKDIAKHDWQNEWSLSDLIRVTCEVGFLPPENKVPIDQVLREYRNFVHPRVEVQKGISITEGHATAAKGMLEVILDELK